MVRTRREIDAPGYPGFDALIDAQFYAIFCRHGAPSTRARDTHVSSRIEIDVRDARDGAIHRVRLPNDTLLDVTLPPGFRDGQILRLIGKGEAGGDALLQVIVR